MKNKSESLVFKATPEIESFTGKYKDQGIIATKLVNNYFEAVSRLLKDIPSENQITNSLEIGCGEGFSTKRLRNLLPNSINIEASEYVAAQIPNAQKRNPLIKITEESVYQLKRNDTSFDLVFLLEVLEHLDYPKLALKEIKRISSSEGYLILGVPREPVWRVLNMFRFKYLKSFGNTPGHLNHWSTTGLVKFIEQNYGPVLAVETPLPWTIVLAKAK